MINSWLRLSEEIVVKVEEIPTRLIGLASRILPSHYTHNDIDSLFLYNGAPDFVTELSKPKKVEAWLRKVNLETSAPLEVLGGILQDFFEKQDLSHNALFSFDDSAQSQLEIDQSKFKEALTELSLRIEGKRITKVGQTAPTLDLAERVKRRGLGEIEIEITRALETVGSDPAAATHYAVNALEATFKAYIEAKLPRYDGSDHLNDLAKAVFDHIGIRPKELDDKDLKMIASGLNSVVSGLMHLRNKKSGAHGRSGAQARSFKILPRHARLAINSAHTISAYVLETLD